MSAAATGDDATASGPPLAQSPLLLLDYDGTLAEINEDPARALPHPEVPELLTELASRWPVRVITGRELADLARLLPVPGLTALGVHGMQEGPLGGDIGWRLDQEARDLLEGVRVRLPVISGIRIEDKVGAIGLHFRGAGDEERVVAELRDWTAGLPSGLETVWGKKIVEIRPRGFDKGRAARELAKEHPQNEPVMIGDDTTDEDAFRALPQGLTIKVGPGDTAARYRLADVDAVVSYLSRYLD